MWKKMKKWLKSAGKFLVEYVVWLLDEIDIDFDD